MLNKTKTDGALSRLNRLIKRNRQGDNTLSEMLSAIKDLLEGSQELTNYLAALNTLEIDAGLTGGETAADLLGTWFTVGIPREVYLGYFAFDSYAKVQKNGKEYYVPVHAAEARAFGHKLRDVVRTVRLTYRMKQDIRNTAPAKAGNPGGVADATAGT